MIKGLLNQYRNDALLRRLTTVLSVDILAKVSGFVLVPIYLRLMNQEEFGLYNYLLSIISTLATVLNFGLYIPQAKYYHHLQTEKERGSLLFTISISLIALLALIVLLVYVFDIDYVFSRILFKNTIPYNEYRGPIALAIVVTVLSFMLINFFYTSEKISKAKWYNISRIIVVNTLVISALYFIKNDAVETRIKYTYVIELALLLLFCNYFVRNLYPHFDINTAFLTLKMGFPIMLSALFGIIINFSDKFFLEKYGTFTDLSNYYLAFSFASVIPMIFASLQNVWVPLFMKEKDLRINLKKTNKLGYRLAVLFFILALVIWIVFKLFLALGIIPAKYYEASTILPFLLIAHIIASLVPLLSNYLVYFEKTHMVSIAGLLVCGQSLGLSLILIPIWGVYGAAIVVLSSNTFYLLLYFLMVKYYSRQYLLSLSKV